MSRLAAMRQLLSTPRDHADQGKIGRKVLYATSDGREKRIYVYRALKSIFRRAA